MDADIEEEKRLHELSIAGEDLELELVTISEPRLRIAPIPPVPSAERPTVLEPPPPPRRSSSTHDGCVPSVACLTGPTALTAEPAPAVTDDAHVLPKPAPLPPPIEPLAAVAAIIDTGEDFDAPPSSDPPISLWKRIEHGGERECADDGIRRQRLASQDSHEEEPVATGPSPDAGPDSADAFLLTRSATLADETSDSTPPLTMTASPSASSLDSTPPLTMTASPSASSLADTVKRRRWTASDEGDEETTLAAAPRPRRAGWFVAAGLVAAAAGLVVYLHETSAADARPHATAAMTTRVGAMPASVQNEPPAATTSQSAPSALVVAPEPARPALGASLLPVDAARTGGTEPVSLTTTTNATLPLEVDAATTRQSGEAR